MNAEPLPGVEVSQHDPQPCAWCGTPTIWTVMVQAEKIGTGKKQVVEAERWVPACPTCSAGLRRMPSAVNERAKAKADAAAWAKRQERLI